MKIQKFVLMRKVTLLCVLLIYVNKYMLVEGCTSAQFECINGECILADYKCDGDVECSDMSDELNCTKPPVCPEGEYRCDNGDCVDSNARCNGFVECGDGSDEINCPGTYTAPVTLTLSGVSSMSNLSDVSNQPSYLLYTSLDQRITTVYVEPTVLFSSKSSFTSEFSNFSSSKDRHTLSTTNLLSSVSNTLILVSTIFQDVTTTSSQESSMDIYSVESKTLTTYSKIHHSNVVTQSINSYVTRSKPHTSSIYSKGVLIYDRTEIDSYNVLEGETLMPTINIYTVPSSTLKLESSSTYETYPAYTPLPFASLTVLYTSIQWSSLYLYSSQYSSDPEVFTELYTSALWLKRSIVQSSLLVMLQATAAPEDVSTDVIRQTEKSPDPSVLSDLYTSAIWLERSIVRSSMVIITSLDTYVGSTSISASPTDSDISKSPDSLNFTTPQKTNILTINISPSVVSISRKGSPKYTPDTVSSMENVYFSFTEEPFSSVFTTFGENIFTTDDVIEYVLSTTTEKYFSLGQSISASTDLTKMSSLLSVRLKPNNTQEIMPLPSYPDQGSFARISMFSLSRQRSQFVTAFSDISKSYEVKTTISLQSITRGTDYFLSLSRFYFFSSNSYGSTSNAQRSNIFTFNSLETFSSYPMYSTAISSWQSSTPSLQDTAALEEISTDVISQTEKSFSLSLQKLSFDDNSYISKSLSTNQSFIPGTSSALYSSLQAIQPSVVEQYLSTTEMTQSVYMSEFSVSPTTTTDGTPPENTTDSDCTLLAVLISIIIVAVVITVIVALAWRHKMRERARMDTHGSILSRNMVRPDPHILYPENIDTVYRTVFRQPRCEREWTRMGTCGSLSSRNLAHTDPYIRYPENKDTVYRTVFRQSRHGFLWY